MIHTFPRVHVVVCACVRAPFVSRVTQTGGVEVTVATDDWC